MLMLTLELEYGCRDRHTNHMISLWLKEQKIPHPSSQWLSVLLEGISVSQDVLHVSFNLVGKTV